MFLVPPLEAQRLTWRDRAGISLGGGVQISSGASEVQELFGRVLVGGSRITQPEIAGAMVHLRLTPRWSLVGGGEAGRRQTISISRVTPPDGGSYAQQNSRYRVVSTRLAGLEWQAFSLGARGRPYVQFRVAGGAGTTEYVLQQWGEFVDEVRVMRFSADLWSQGRGTFVFVGTALDIPLHRSTIIRMDVRQSRGWAPTSADFADFKRIDIGGTRIGGALVLYPGSWGRR